MLRNRLTAGALATALATSVLFAPPAAAADDPATPTSTAPTSATPTPATTTPTSTSTAQAACLSDPDATAYAVQAFLAVGDRDAADAALAYLVRAQIPAGSTDAQDVGGLASAPVNGVAGTPNANTTGLSAADFGLGGDATAANFRLTQGFLLGLQQPAASADAGAVAYDHAAGFVAATATRSTAQAVLGLVDTPTRHGTDLLTVSKVGATDGNPTLGNADVSAAQGAAGWLARQLEINGDHLVTSGFDDWGLTADAVLAFDAAGVSQTDAAKATSALENHVTDYTGDPGTGESYAGSLAKLIVLAEAQQTDPTDFGGQNLVGRLQDREVSAGQFAGRFSDESAYGDYSNAITQSLALIALERADDHPSTAAVASLQSLQCSDGGLEISYPEVAPPTTSTSTSTSTRPTSATSTSSAPSSGTSSTRSTSASSASKTRTTSSQSGTSTTTATGHAVVTISDQTVTPGQSITVTASGFQPGETVRVALHSTPVVLGTLTMDSAGSGSGTVTIPDGAAIGQHTIELTGQTSGLVASTGIVVVQSLASTGVSSGVVGLGIIGLILALGGALMLVVARRRAVTRRTPATADGQTSGSQHR